MYDSSGRACVQLRLGEVGIQKRIRHRGLELVKKAWLGADLVGDGTEGSMPGLLIEE